MPRSGPAIVGLDAAGEVLEVEAQTELARNAHVGKIVLRVEGA